MSDLKESIIIVIEKDGSHYFRLPEDDSLEFNRDAYVAFMNTVTILDEPSLVLRFVLWVERGFRSLLKVKSPNTI